jgi:FkbM family methyltransferase
MNTKLMLIPTEKFLSILLKNKIIVNGIFHIGALDCEELPFYKEICEPNSIIWIDALEFKVNEQKAKGVPNVYCATISDKDDGTVNFNVSNNYGSSSILPFGTHTVEHPHIHYIGFIPTKTVTIDTFFQRNNLDPTKCNLWNIDIQGAEMLALKGGTNALKYANVLYLEVNEKELYTGCPNINEIDDFVFKLGFRRVLTEMTKHGWGDAVYIKN